MTPTKVERFFEYFFLALMMMLLIGTPLLFTSLTRSVFEVNKLLLLRLISLVALGGWFIKAVLLQQMTPKDPDAKTFAILGLTWKRIGLEVPALVWLGFNIVSTILSQSVIVSIIGAYDRWEGIVTVINYIFLVYMFAKLVEHKWQFKWCIIGILVPAALSAVYGVYQSVGWDFMRWSVNPTSRVFACINNPVHFCAYVAMVVPMGVGWMLYLSSRVSQARQEFSQRAIVFGRLIRWGSFAVSQVLLYISSGFTPMAGIVTGLCLVAFLLQRHTKDSVMTQKGLGLWAAFGVVVAVATWFDLIHLGGTYWVTFGLFFILYYIFAPAPDWTSVLQRCVYACTILVFYSQFLSFSRATWVGFVGASTVFYLLTTGLFRNETQKTFLKDAMLSSLCVGIYYLYAIFHIEAISPFMMAVVGVLLAGIFVYNFVMSNQGELLVTGAKRWVFFAILSAILFLVFGIDLSNLLSPYIVYPVVAGLVIYLISMLNRLDDAFQTFAARMSFILLFAKLQFITVSVYNILLYAVLVYILYRVAFKANNALNFETKKWAFGFLIVFGVVLVAPSMPFYLNKVLAKPVTYLGALGNVENRINTYDDNAMTGTARTSMWKSAIPWIKDYWLIGSGPDTTKYKYPTYRRPEYGILEGGHNFTPDRLHNEYINTMATKGIFATAVYYGWFLLGWMIMMLVGFYKYEKNPYRFVVAGCLTGAMVYLGQVMFNFGVVATLVLFYILIGLGLAVVVHKDFANEQDR